MRVGPLSRLSTRLLEVILVIAVVGVALLSVVRPLVGPSGVNLADGPFFGALPVVPVTLAASVDVHTVPALPTLGDGVIQAGHGLELGPTGAEVTVWGPDAQQRVSLVGPSILGGLITLGVLLLLLLMVRSLRRGDPFVPANARRLLGIAALVGIGGEAVDLLGAWGRLVILDNPQISPYVVRDFHVSWLPLVAGVGIAVAAEVFRRGTDLRGEVAGLV